MNYIGTGYNAFDHTVSTGMSYIDTNPYLTAILVILLIAYASTVAPRLPKNVLRMFDNSFAQFFVFFLIAYISQKNVTVAIVATICVFVTLSLLHRYDYQEHMIGQMTHVHDENCSNGSECTMNMNYTDKFYPQYINLKPDSYKVRFNGNDVTGYDDSVNYNNN